MAAGTEFEVEVNASGSAHWDDVECSEQVEQLRKIWWLASWPKSGNTMVRMFLNVYVTKFRLDINAAYQYATLDQQEQLFRAVSAKSLEH